MHNQKALDYILNQKLLPLFYHEDEGASLKILEALFAAGIRTVEYTNRGENALDNFRILAKKKPGEMQLGIGTIKTKDQARSFIDAGADYLVCPTVNPEVAQVAHKAGLLWIPGCLTPTEISIAEMNGAELVKIFPGNILGPGYISSIKDLFPALKFMPTGGVESELKNLESWFNAGVVAVGMGSRLISKQVLQEGSFDLLTERTKEAIQLVNQASGISDK